MKDSPLPADDPILALTEEQLCKMGEASLFIESFLSARNMSPPEMFGACLVTAASVWKLGMTMPIADAVFHFMSALRAVKRLERPKQGRDVN